MLGLREVFCDNENIKVWGRTTSERKPLTLFWTGSGIEMNVSGSEMWVTIDTDHEAYEPWISILIDGTVMQRMMLPKGRHEICVFRSLTPTNYRNVKIIKDMQAMSDDTKSLLQIVSIKTDGAFMPVEDKKYHLEFIGDSITSGEGGNGAKNEMDWVSAVFSSINNYGYMTAKALDAEYRVVSQSGWGFYHSWDGHRENSIPQYYEQICGLLKGQRNIELGAHDKYDFASYKTDAVIINLGTNDISGCGGTVNDENKAILIKAAVDFLSMIRKNNPDSHIVWVYGMLGNGLEDTLKEAVVQYKENFGDENVAYLALPDTQPDQLGSREHPGLISHQNTAKVISEYLRKVLNIA